MSTPHKTNPTDYQVQEMIRESFNDAYKILETAGYYYDATTDTFKPDTATQNNRFGGGLTPYAKVLTASDTIAPAAGKKLQVYWVSFVPDSDNSTANQVTVGFNTSGQTLYIGYGIAHWEIFTGNTDEVLTITLANAQPVAVMVHYKSV